ncbi:MAG TPA: protein kinase [Gaiellaceae bacterium]|nr:protein kinase [Gaiellaceae bacterium]
MEGRGLTAAAVAGRYRVERRLGEGGMARVDLARDVELDRLVAVKVLAEHLADDPELRERFLREGRLAARLAHPHVVAVYDAGEERGLPYLVMEYVDGETVGELARRRGRLPAREAVELAAQALTGLEHAHASGLVHRDVKPGNLLVRRDGTLKIGDFGIARAIELSGLTEAGTVLGTAAYLAPEQARGEQVGPAADVYSLAAVLYELLTGRPPREISSLAELGDRAQEPVRPVRDLRPDVPPAVEEAVMRALAARPEHRPSAAELRAELSGGAPVERAAAEAPTAVVATRRRRRRAALLLLPVPAVAALLVSSAYLAARDDGENPPASPPAAQPTTIPPPQPGATPEETARNLSDWLRAHARPAGAP